MKSAAKVGLLLIVFLVLFAAGFGILGRSLFAAKEDVYGADFPDAAGVTVGTRVLLAGVKVGTVTNVSLLSPTQARMTLNLTKGTKLPVGTEAVIPGSLIGLGDTPIQLTPPATYATYLDPGSVLPGRKAGPLDALLPGGGKGAYNELTKTLVAVRKLLEDQQLTGNVKTLLKTTNQTLATSQGTLKSFQALADRGTRLIDQNQATLVAILGGARETLTEVHSSAHEIAALLRSGKLQNGAMALLQRATRIEDQSSHLLASLDRTINDPQLQRNLKSIVGNTAETTARGPAIADNAVKISGNVADITNSSKELPGKLGTVLDKASKLEDQLSDLTGKVGGFFNHKTSGIGLPSFTVGMDLFRQSDPGYWRTDLGVRVPLADGFVDAGIYDAFERNKLTAQLGRNLGGGLDYRYGIYASKPAVGVDYALGRRISLRSDLWDINSPRLDARLRFDFGNGLIGWLGADRILRDNAPTIGIGIRR